MEHEIISGVRLFAILQLLILSVVLMVVYHGRMSNRVYNRSRYMLVVGTLVVVATFTAQFLGHYRETQPCLSWSLNVLCYSIACPLFVLSGTNLLRGGHTPKKTLRILTLYWVATFLLYVVGAATGILVNNENALHSLTFPICIVFTIMAAYSCFNLFTEMRRTDRILSSVEMAQRRRLLSYTASSLNALMVLILLAPWVAMSPSLWLNALLGICFAPVVAWYLIAFICYGFRMDEVIEAENAIVEAEDETESAPVSVADSELDNLVESRVLEWIEQKHFIDPSLTINKAARQMGISTASLNRHISDQYGMSYRSWIPFLRIEHSKSIILENPNLSNESVAAACGFVSRTAFQRSFAEHVGMPPKQWADEAAEAAEEKDSPSVEDEK